MTGSTAIGVHEDEGGFLLRSPDGVSYRVDVCAGTLSSGHGLLASYLDGRRVCGFVSPTVDRLYGDRIRAYLRASVPDTDWALSVLPSGEHNKTLGAAENVCAIAKHNGLDRNGIMFGIGGGTINDVVGFAASIYARGVRYMRLNTTLVGQVDVGVGVKTGVNGLGAKNAVGTYHAPYASINDTDFLATLPRREILCGLAEVIKMAVIRDEALFRTIEENAEAVERSELGRATLRSSMRLMLEELCPNIREVDLARLVDFGHTFGPTIETASAYRVAHGESVAIDMAISCHIGRLLGLCRAEDCERIVDLLAAVGLPIFDEETCVPELIQDALRAAWQRRGRRLNLVVPTGIGTATFVTDLEDLSPSVAATALRALRARATTTTFAATPGIVATPGLTTPGLTATRC